MPQTIDHYGVMGDPIGHSKSPFIHARFAEQTGQRIQYSPLHVRPDNFSRAVDEFERCGGRGLNITVPHKEAAYRLLREWTSGKLTPRAERANAVNTVVFPPVVTDADADPNANADPGQRLGDNTDGMGLMRDLKLNLGVSLAGRKILLLGAGGAAWGVLGPLLDEGPAHLVVANRTPEKAVALATALAAAFATDGPDGSVTGCGFDGLAGGAFDLIINATAASLEGEAPPIPGTALKPGGECYDLMYAGAPTAFVRWGRDHDAALSVDGLGMLVEQAALSFQLWRGVLPETAPVIAALRESLGNF